MSLPASEQRVLNAMEDALKASEPRMTAMFAMFGKLTRGEEPTDAERLPRGRLTRLRPGTSYLLIPVLAAVALVATLVVGLAAGGLSGCRTGGASQAPRSAASCDARLVPLGRR